MPLTDIKVRNLKPGTKQQKHFDSGGLFVLVTPAGGKCWRLKYRFGGKEKQLALGRYPEVSLKKARMKRDKAREQLSDGIDPSEFLKAQKASLAERSENSFEVVAREWHGKFTPSWSATHAATTIRRLERDVFPWMGSSPIDNIKAPELLTVLRRIESRGAMETAHRVKTICGQVFRYSVATGRADRDVAADLKGALPPVSKKHHPSITEPAKVGGLLRAIDSYEGSFVVKCALGLAALVFVRPGELRQAEWSEFDLGAGEWNIPVERMKLPKMAKEARKGEKHLVPLSTQAVAILRELHPMTGQGCFVFPSSRSVARPMSDNTINAALRRLGYGKDEMTGHGFRAMARTILDEVLHIRPDFIEHQLAHAVRDPNGRAYNRTAYLPERQKMMQTWADYLYKLKGE